MIHNRSAPRKECLAKIRVSWQSAGRGLKEWGMVQDKSLGGLGIRFPFAIDVGSVIAIAQGFSTSFGIVRHCTKIRGQFFLGVEFCEVEEGTKPAASWNTSLNGSSPREEEKAPATAVPPDQTPTLSATAEEEVETEKAPLKPTGLRADFAMMKPPPRK